MGPGIIEAASYHETDRENALAMQRLPYRGRLITSPSGEATDSAAAATAMACGVFTSDRAVGVDRDRQPVPHLIELPDPSGDGHDLGSPLVEAGFTYVTTRDELQQALADEALRVLARASTWRPTPTTSA